MLRCFHRHTFWDILEFSGVTLRDFFRQLRDVTKTLRKHSPSLCLTVFMESFDNPPYITSKNLLRQFLKMIKAFFPLEIILLILVSFSLYKDWYCWEKIDVNRFWNSKDWSFQSQTMVLKYGKIIFTLTS